MSLTWVTEWFSFHRQLSSHRVYIWFWLHFEHHLKNGGRGQDRRGQNRKVHKGVQSGRLHSEPWRACLMVSFELLCISEMISNSVVTFVFCPRIFRNYRRQQSLPYTTSSSVDYSPQLPIPTVLFNWWTQHLLSKPCATFQNIWRNILLPGLTPRFTVYFRILLSFWRH